MAAQSLLGWCLALLGAGTVASLLVSRRRELAGWVAFAAVAVAWVPLGWVVVEGFARGVKEFDVLALPSVGARLAVAVDPLSALFLVIMAVIALAAVLFSVRYGPLPDRLGGQVLPGAADLLRRHDRVQTMDLLFFLVFWELMTDLLLLGTFERESRASQRAGLKLRHRPCGHPACWRPCSCWAGVGPSPPPARRRGD
jgi:formate hydrogenlyase subunit 3/multisubunit Na+/H+ antiporter MnhD subunit